MGQDQNVWDKILDKLFNTRAGALYMVLFALAIAIATFIENDYGTSAAQKVIFQAKWFELLLIFFGISLIFSIVKFRMIPLKKWPLFLFHSSMIIIIMGAGVTRYFGYEGSMRIREGESANSFFSSEPYISFQINDGESQYGNDTKVLFASLGSNNFDKKFIAGNDKIDLELLAFIPNPKQVLEESPEGKPQIKVVYGGAEGREEYYIAEGQTRLINNQLFNFTNEEVIGAFNIKYQNDSLFFKSESIYTQMVMATRTSDTLVPTTNYYPLRLRSFYSDGNQGFVFGDFVKSGVVKTVSSDQKVMSNSTVALKMKVGVNGQYKTTMVYGMPGLIGKAAQLNIDNRDIALRYGSKMVEVPFELKLFDFELKKYPGTNSPASYSSYVQLTDSRNNLEESHHIYMNNILDHDGYRFFQSAFDPDEKGTILSVNHDFWGTWISYIGYIILTFGMIWTLFSKKTRFSELIRKISKLREKGGTFMWAFLFLSSFSLSAQAPDTSFHPSVISLEHTEVFNRLIVQDFEGRMKPIHTLTREAVRKLFGKEGYLDMNADQVFLGMFVNSEEWYGIPLMKLGQHKNVKKLLGVAEDAKHASYMDFFTKEGVYKLNDEVRRIYALQPIDRGTYEREILKLDEKLNIANMIFSGTLLKVIPKINDPNNTWMATQWGNPPDVPRDSLATYFFETYVGGLRGAIQNNDYAMINELTEVIGSFQKKKGNSIIPSDNKIEAEIQLNNSHVFNWLTLSNFILAMLFLMFLIISVFKTEWPLKKIYYVLYTLLIISFLFHTAGLGLRWYVSGRAPWSNGYESMIYIAWTTTLAGVILSRKSFGGLAATTLLAATILGVAILSYMNPQITPLVPVLKSYWLTIHVSLEAGSYGFLGLGAFIGIINLILMIFATDKNIKQVTRIVKEMTYISELTLIVGIFMISVGTYLGGVWANESWGRYWGWDAKETWALVSILVYAFILHMRFIPPLKGLFAFNFANLFGIATIIMTYYGVNYYLSGLHSYATGDPIPIPSWVYYSAGLLMVISMLAYWRKSKFDELK